jgi:hypothetical protein
MYTSRLRTAARNRAERRALWNAPGCPACGGDRSCLPERKPVRVVRFGNQKLFIERPYPIHAAESWLHGGNGSPRGQAILEFPAVPMQRSAPPGLAKSRARPVSPIFPPALPMIRARAISNTAAGQPMLASSAAKLDRRGRRDSASGLSLNRSGRDAVRQLAGDRTALYAAMRPQQPVRSGAGGNGFHPRPRDDSRSSPVPGNLLRSVAAGATIAKGCEGRRHEGGAAAPGTTANRLQE